MASLDVQIVLPITKANSFILIFGPHGVALAANQGFEVIAVNVDAKLSDALRFLKKFPIDYPILLDSAYTMAQIYEVQGLPTAYLIDTEGNVIYKHLGFKEADKKWITALIEQNLPALKKQP